MALVGKLRIATNLLLVSGRAGVDPTPAHSVRDTSCYEAAWMTMSPEATGEEGMKSGGQEP